MTLYKHELKMNRLSFLIWLAAFWIILATTTGAVVSIDRRYLENAATLEMPRMERLFRVVLRGRSLQS